MCLAIPVEIESISDLIARCRVGAGETYLEVSLMLMAEEVKVGDYLIVHAGFALRKIETAEAEESLKILREMLKLADGTEPEACGF